VISAGTAEGSSVTGMLEGILAPLGVCDGDGVLGLRLNG
jgi:hypothetical protein